MKITKNTSDFCTKLALDMSGTDPAGTQGQPPVPAASAPEAAPKQEKRPQFRDNSVVVSCLLDAMNKTGFSAFVGNTVNQNSKVIFGTTKRGPMLEVRIEVNEFGYVEARVIDRDENFPLQDASKRLREIFILAVRDGRISALPWDEDTNFNNVVTSQANKSGERA